jgi:hypothetical protein
MANTCDEQQVQVDFAALHEAQRALCKANGWPHFAPRVCWHCRREIYSHPSAQSAAGTSLITGCPHCHASYCD